jgi:hypothetical protein
MAAALEWITSQGLAASAADPDRVWAACEEVVVCVRSGILRRRGSGGGGPGTAEGLLAWVLEAGQDKAVPLARMAAFRLLAEGIIADCPVRACESYRKCRGSLRVVIHFQSQYPHRPPSSPPRLLRSFASSSALGPAPPPRPPVGSSHVRPQLRWWCGAMGVAAAVAAVGRPRRSCGRRCRTRCRGC